MSIDLDIKTKFKGHFDVLISELWLHFIQNIFCNLWKYFVVNENILWYFKISVKFSLSKAYMFNFVVKMSKVTKFQILEDETTKILAVLITKISFEVILRWSFALFQSVKLVMELLHQLYTLTGSHLTWTKK